MYALPAALTFSGGPPTAAPVDAAHRIGEAVGIGNALTILMQIETADVLQRGPARIVSYSLDPFHRNFDVGQQERRVVFRIRTPTTGPNANDWRTETPNVLEPNRVYLVAATYDGTVARLYLDGQLYGRSNLMAAGCAMPALCDAGMPFAHALLGASFALVALGWLQPKARRRMQGIAICAGATSALLQWGVHALFAASVPNPWFGLLNVAGAFAIAVGLIDEKLPRPGPPWPNDGRQPTPERVGSG
jgi:hypothetical protein